ncbi:MAG: TonB-dependent receptor [Tannerella sp.]|jgi:TonB-linked SusC/RagA family outer membrane protein|nr:TonB-dependent receptor [Tannerella sp.]
MNKKILEKKKKALRKIIIAVCALCFTFSLYAQRTVSGTVTDVNDEPISGVSVAVKGTPIGTVTDTQGTYRLNVPENAILVFSYIGYVAQEINVTNQTAVSVRLLEDLRSLDEVVVIGYGEHSKKKLSTAITKVSSKDINHLPVTNPGDALTGLAAGVQVQSGSGGTPGSTQIIRIRGAGSLGASNEPLYVVDGYPLPNADQFARINVSDIESMEILKDAASAAIYGSRAANGVVIVTTKRGKAEKTSFNVNAYTGFQQVTKKIPVMNKAEYLQYAYDARSIANIKLPDIYDTPDLLADTDWQDEIFRIAPMSEIQINAEGGSQKTQFAVSGNYITQEGTLVGTDYQIGSFRANIDSNLYPSLKIGVNFNPSFTHRRLQRDQDGYSGSYYTPIYNALFLPPIVPARKENGDYGLFSEMPYNQYGFVDTGIGQPLAVLELFQHHLNSFNLLTNAFLQWEPLKGLVIRTQGGATVGSAIETEYVPSTLSSGSAFTSANLSTPELGAIRSRERSYRAIDWVWENTATYTFNLRSKHHLTAMLLYSMQKYQFTQVSTQGTVNTYTNDLVHNSTASTSQLGGLGFGLNSFMSYAARVNYDFQDKYILSAAIRTDASSRFGSNRRFATFPSFSAAWRITQESFMDNQNLFSELKIRGSYGETGNAGIGDFTWMSGIGTQNYSFNNQRVAGTLQSGFMNPNLTWEKNRQVDIGLEASFLKDRIYLTVDMYRKITQGMLFSKELPGIIGYASSFQTNIGKIRNDGLEVAVTTYNFTRRSFRWRTDFNISFNVSKVLDLGGRQSLNASTGIPTGNWGNVYRIEVGQPLGNMYGFIIDGVYKRQEDVDKGPAWPGSAPGSYIVRNTNGDDKVDEQDRTLLGNGFPDYVFGMTNTLSYKNFDLSIILQGVQGNNILNGAFVHSELLLANFNATKSLINNYYMPDNPDRDVKYAKLQGSPGFNPAFNLPSYGVHDGSFVRIRNITLGYTIPAQVLKRIFIQSARIYLSAQNPFTFTDYPFYNPEPSAYGSSVYQPGSDQATYPANRTFLLGLNINF